MKLSVIKHTPTHIIAGFLGAGKTTFLNTLLRQKPATETWAILINEFGQIGIDQCLLPDQSGYAIKELLGGCLCCSSQLPMQIALSRLLSEVQPDRLFIEPTGLGHPAQLIEQLTEPHWQQYLCLKSPITVIDGSKIQHDEWMKHPLYTEQLKAAQMIVVSHLDRMQPSDFVALNQLKQEFKAYAKTWLAQQYDQILLSQLDLDYVAAQRQIQPLLQLQKAASITQQPVEIKKLPYHYVETAQHYSVAGWKFPKRWMFNFHDVLDLLCEQKDWLRIKAILYTDQGWKAFNFNAEQFNYQDTIENIDNRLEIIYQSERHWNDFETQLLSCCRADHPML
ncbi:MULTISPECIES: CobW family GTP-binding protein [unclassified Acinetobacter]|uniref:CobW family GTP-binding protein n=1 Tax=unclassified Acinetobacter TaxID=196816 RepID=UPI002934AF1C|nr:MULTISPECIES: GTP-binding protein [unclassified Acinetobacter]WOE32715.1 GTP-binding protein [Acinetobacter sp. SAAs470]WOE38191.1 GTP-binding protein [Acinetobacter sp. SAAs474]